MAKIPIILEPGRADGKLVSSDAIFDENKGMFQSEINDIQDTLNSDNSKKPLSAKQGKVLKELLDNKVIEAGSVPIDTEPIKGNITHLVNSDGLAKEFNKCNTAIINTDRIEDGAVTSEKISPSAFDDTLFVSGKIAPADVVGAKLTELETNIAEISGINQKIDLSKLEQRAGIINDGSWAGVTAGNRYKHVFVPTESKYTYLLRNLTSQIASYAFLKNNNEPSANGELPSFCSGHNKESKLSTGNEITITTPDDCKFIYVTTLYNGNDSTLSIIRTESGSINEINKEISNIKNGVSSIEKSVEDLHENIDNSKMQNSLYLSNTYFDSTTGDYIERTNTNATQKIAVKENFIVTTEYNMFRVAKWDSEKKFLGLDICETKTYIVPNGVSMIAIAFFNQEVFGNIYIDGKIANGFFVKDMIETFDNAINRVSRENPIYYFEKSIDSSSGEYIDKASCFVTLDIPVKEGDIILAESKIFKVGLYTDNGFIKEITNINHRYVVDNGVSKIRIAFLNTNPRPITINGIRVNALIIDNIKNNAKIPQVIINHVTDINNPHHVTAEQIGINDVSHTKSGLMSPSDKIKLDNILSPISITINGSGVTKNASAFNFLPTNTADENAVALQNCINGGGTIIVDYPGVYDLSKTMLIGSNTELIFGEGVVIRKCADSNGVQSHYMFLNEGALTRTYNENIIIKGLNLLTNGIGWTGGLNILGLHGNISLFYVKNVTIDGLTIHDSSNISIFNVHICTFYDVNIKNVRISSFKDGLHFGRGNKLTIENCHLSTKDDSIALNAFDYATSNPEYGWIENISINNIYIPMREGGNGRVINILGGSWLDWRDGNMYQSIGDACVNNGNVYRTLGNVANSNIVSSYAPNLEQFGVKQQFADGLVWVLSQKDATYNAGIRNLFVSNITIEPPLSVCFNIFFEADVNYCKSYYVGSKSPIYENFKFSKILCKNKCTNVFDCLVPTHDLLISDSVLFADNIIKCRFVNGDHPDYPVLNMAMVGNTFVKECTETNIVAENRNIKLKAVCNIPVNDNFTCNKTELVQVINSDI